MIVERKSFGFGFWFYERVDFPDFLGVADEGLLVLSLS